MTDEMITLRQMLDANGIGWLDVSDAYGSYFDVWRTYFRVNGKWKSVAHGYGSYGGWNLDRDEDKGLLEFYDFENDPIGFLTADEVMEIVLGNADENRTN